MPPFSDNEVEDHPLTVYRKAHNEARAKVEREIDKQQAIATNSADDAAATEAAGEVFKLTAKLGLLVAEHDRFLVTVVVKSINHGPDKLVVTQTQALAEKLAEAIKKKNSSMLALNALTKYLSGAIAVFNGTVPAAAAAPVPPSPVPPTPLAPVVGQ